MIRFTKHAQEAISARDIAVDWIEAAVSAPIGSNPIRAIPIASDPIRRSRKHGGRVLRVVHRPEGDDILIITVHFDRRARR
jgi:hypothetical protein